MLPSPPINVNKHHEIRANPPHVPAKPFNAKERVVYSGGRKREGGEGKRITYWIDTRSNIFLSNSWQKRRHKPVEGGREEREWKRCRQEMEEGEGEQAGNLSGFLTAGLPEKKFFFSCCCCCCVYTQTVDARRGAL